MGFIRSVIQWFQDYSARRKRLLFRVFDGRRMRAIDPWQAYRSLKNDPEFNPLEGLEEVRSNMEPETSRCMRSICRAFNVELFDSRTQRGLTEAELLYVLDEFLTFCEGVQKKTPDGSTSAQPTESTLSGSPAVQ